MKTKIYAGLVLVTLLAALTFLAGCAEKSKSAEITVHFVQNGKVFDENWEIYQLAAQKTNVTLKSVSSKNNTDTNQAFNLMVASGKLPDIIGYTVAGLENLAAEDGMTDLTPYIEKYAPNIKKFMKDNPRLAKDMYALDGKIYVIPTYYDYDNLNVAYGLFLRGDWLKKYNLSVPTTVAELEKVLSTFINNDANGNGKKDEVGLFARSPGGVVDAVRYTAGVLGARPYNSFYVENDTVNYSPLESTFKTAIATMADWYKKGLVDKELFTRGGSAREQLLPTNQGSATFDWFASTGAFNDSIKDIPGFEFIPVPPLKDENGKVLSRSLARATNNYYGWGMSAQAKNPVAVIKFMDWWFSPEGRRAWNWGIEGKYYTMVDGKPQFTDYVLKNPEGLTPINALYLVGSQIAAVGVWQDAEYERATAKDIAKKGWEIYMTPGYVYPDMPTLKFSQAESQEISKIDAAINQTTAEYVQKWILGTANINADWDTYVKRLKELGVDRSIEIRQTAYNRFIGKK